MEKDELNKRRFIRVNFPFTIHINPSDGVPISTYTEDISEGGVKVFIAEKLKTSSIVILAIYLGSEPVACKGKVVWARRRTSEFIDGETFFDTGIEFQEIKEKDRLLLKEKVAELEKERQSKKDS